MVNKMEVMIRRIGFTCGAGGGGMVVRVWEKMRERTDVQEYKIGNKKSLLR